MNTFQLFGLQPEILSSIEKLDYITPTPIQEQAIPLILNETQDIMALAQTGTGKTAAFGLPILNMLNPLSRDVQTLILCPTRELCLQITRDLKNYSQDMKQVNIVPVYGGSSMETQIKGIRRGAQIIVGTPGRVNDLTKRGIIKYDHMRWFILDEADEMLRMGFKDELDTIKAQLPETYRTFLFSATMPGNIKRYLVNPIEITVGKRNISADHIEHHYYLVEPRVQYDALKRILDATPDLFAIIFCRTREECRVISEKLIAGGYRADALHGELSQNQRDYVMNRFRNKLTSVLVATDIAARGLDVTHLTHIINYALPEDPEAYIHRSGRCGRAGRTGVAISLVHPRRKRHLFFLERLAGKRFEQKQIPAGEDVCRTQLMSMIDNIVKTDVQQEELAPYMDDIHQKLSEFERPELINKFISSIFSTLLKEYSNAADLNPDQTRSDSNFSGLTLNMGSRDRLTPPRLIALINQIGEEHRVKLGKIDIGFKKTFFEVDSRFESYIITGMSDLFVNDKPVEITAAPKNSRNSRPRQGGRNYQNDNGRKFAHRKRRK